MAKDRLHSEYRGTNTNHLNLLRKYAMKERLITLLIITRINLKTEGRMKTMATVVLDPTSTII